MELVSQSWIGRAKMVRITTRFPVTSLVASKALLTTNQLPPTEEKEAALNENAPKPKKSLLGLRERLIKAFQDNGLTAQDLTTAIIIHEALGIFMLALTWSLCYFVQLSTLPMLKEPLNKIASMMPKMISNNEFLNSRLGVAYCESSCLRKLIRPLTLPTKVIVTVKLVQLIHALQHKRSSPSIPLSLPSSDVAMNSVVKPVAWEIVSNNDNSEVDNSSQRNARLHSVRLGKGLQQKQFAEPKFSILF